MSSEIVLAGTDGFTAMTLGARMMPATGAMSRMKSKLSFSYNVALIALYPPDHEQRVAVGRCTYNRLGADIAAATRPVVDNKLLAEALRQPLPHQARDD